MREEYWVYTVMFPGLYSPICKTTYSQDFPSAQDLKDEQGREGNLIFMRKLTRDQFEKITGRQI